MNIFDLVASVPGPALIFVGCIGAALGGLAVIAFAVFSMEDES